MIVTANASCQPDGFPIRAVCLSFRLIPVGWGEANSESFDSCQTLLPLRTCSLHSMNASTLHYFVQTVRGPRGSARLSDRSTFRLQNTAIPRLGVKHTGYCLCIGAATLQSHYMARLEPGRISLSMYGVCMSQFNSPSTNHEPCPHCTCTNPVLPTQH